MTKTTEYDICVYCGGLVGTRGVGDHMPIPRRNGGTETVPACMSCHDMKDRFTLEKWPLDWWLKVMADWPKMSRETRIFLAKTAAALTDAMAANDTLQKAA
jgi:hypothetical protein